MFIWNKEKYPFSIMDADTMDKFNGAFSKMWSSIVDYEKENAKDGMIYGEGIKEECKIMDTFLTRPSNPEQLEKCSAQPIIWQTGRAQ